MVGTGNPLDLVLVVAGGALVVWDMATTPGEVAEAVQPALDQIQKSIDDQQRMLDELNGSSSKSCPN